MTLTAFYFVSSITDFFAGFQLVFVSRFLKKATTTNQPKCKYVRTLLSYLFYKAISDFDLWNVYIVLAVMIGK